MREPSLFCATGMKGVGKTHATKIELKKYIYSDGNVGRKGRPVLILDGNQEYTDAVAIDYDSDIEDINKRGVNISKCQSGKLYRIIPYKKDGQPFSLPQYKDAALTIMHHFRNGAIMFEDINKYQGRSFADEWVGRIISQRHVGNDMFMHFQSMSKIPTTIWENMNYLRIHDQLDSLIRYKNRIPPYEVVSIALNIVRYRRKVKGIKYTFVWVDCMENKIFDVTSAEFEVGCRKFLMENKQFLKESMLMADTKDFETAIRFYIKEHNNFLN